MLNNLDTESVRIELSSPNRAGLISPIYNESKEENIIMLVMPIMLS
jgi:DNA polymerase-3 subunit beta